MKRFSALGALVLLLLVAAVAYAQEQQRLGNILITRAFQLGAGVPFVMEGTTNDAFEFRMFIDPTEDIMWQLPTAAGAAGTQLQTNGVVGGEVLTWASAGSSMQFKTLDGMLDPQEALATVMKTPIHRFHYNQKAPKGVNTGDFITQYAGPLAEEAPWAMHHEGKILNPVNTIGYPIAAIQAQQAEIDALKAEIAALKAGR